LDSIRSGQGPVAGCCECGDEPSGSFATELVILENFQLCKLPSASEKLISMIIILIDYDFVLFCIQFEK
jgi:hypothetical protein